MQNSVTVGQLVWLFLSTDLLSSHFRCMRPPLRVPVDHVSAELDDKEDDSFDPSSLEVTDLRFQPVLQVTKNQATTYNSHCLNIPANGLMIGMRLFIKHELLGKGGFSMVSFDLHEANC